MLSISISPNTRPQDLWLALKLLFKPRQWVKGAAANRLETTFRSYFKVSYAFAVLSGRAALYSILKSFGIREMDDPFDKTQGHPERQSKDEILLQAFTCNAVVNPIIAVGAKPIYVDIDENTYNIDLDDLKRKITSKARAVIVQHTFGKAGPIEEILEIAKEKNLLVIEDCAHSLGAKHNAKLLGTFGDIAFFSFGRDKTISSVFGGMIMTKNQELAEKIKKQINGLSFPTYYWTMCQLLHPIVVKTLVLPFYNVFELGKVLFVALQQLRVLSKAVSKEEKCGKLPKWLIKKMPNALAELALLQFSALDELNKHRKEIASIYAQELENSSLKLPLWGEEHLWLRYPVRTPKAQELIKAARQQRMMLGDWYQSPVDPKDTKLEAMRYELGSCPVAEKVSKEIINLPTHINMTKQDAERVITFLKNIELRIKN